MYTRPSRLSLRAIAEHAELKRVASRLQQDTGTAIALPSYDQVRAYVRTLTQEPKVREAREALPRPGRDRQSPRSFALSIPAPAQLVQVDEHSMELYVITPDGIPVTRRVHAAVLVCVKTAAIMSAVQFGIAVHAATHDGVIFDYLYPTPFSKIATYTTLLMGTVMQLGIYLLAIPAWLRIRSRGK